ncbi:MAG: hypothetical protein JRI53_00840 [Deltaproteobacteria bacterium]|nr:hypothetical protein [Deltaproteobacteria bacterium]MBW1846360.1 hypothetical protein [Deltaproteobacteria bacterium]MBW1983238.1 hypothetical protein [Deltaproteobacteria bacterium]MBW2180274.1 hypothetical protein [Deltaproteobacteria bacterium]
MNTTDKEQNQQGVVKLLLDLMVKHHLHPISIHVPNGMLPFTVIFIVLATVFDLDIFYKVSFINLAAIVLTLPVVLFTGIVEWKIKYGGKLTKIFKQKIISAIAVAILTIVLLVWCVIYPMDSDAPNIIRYTYALTALILLIPTTIAGNIGGKLVFKEFGK